MQAVDAYPHTPGSDEEAQHFFHWSDFNVWEEGFNKAVEVQAPVVQAIKDLVSLHMAEQEGLSSGKPTASQWYQAVDKAIKALTSIGQSCGIQD